MSDETATTDVLTDATSEETVPSMAHDLVVPTHRGVLADLGSAARDVAVDEYLKTYVILGEDADDEDGDAAGVSVTDEIVQVLREACMPGAVQERLLTLLLNAPVEWLEHAMGIYEADVPASKARKKMAAAVAKAMVAHPQDVLEQLSQTEGPQVRGVRRTVEAGGVLVVSEAQLTLEALSEVPVPLAPYLFAFYQPGDVPGAGQFTFVVPEELRPLMEQADWGQVLQLNDKRTRVHRYMDAAIWMRGIQDADSLADEYAAANPGGMSADEAADEMVYAIQQSFVEAAILATPGDQFYLMAPAVATVYSDAHPNACIYEGDYRLLQGELDNTLKGILDAHTERPACPVSEDILQSGEVWEWYSSTPAAQNLQSFLDAHVPEGEDDYLYADGVLEELSRIARLGLGPDDLRSRLEELFPTDNAQDLARAYDLAAAFVLGLPCWYLNGHSMMDLQQE